MNIVRPNVEEACPPLAVSRATTISPPIFSGAISTPAAPASSPISITRQGWTYGDLAERVERFGHVLRALGIRREERVLLCLLDTIDWPTAFLGAIKAGVVPVPVNTLLTEDDYRFMLEDSRARLLVVSEALYPKFAEARRRRGRSGRTSSSSAPKSHGRAPVRRRSLAGAARRSGDGADRARRHRASGSTRRARPASRRARCTPRAPDAHRRALRQGRSSASRENDVVFSVAKLFFAYGLGNALTFPMSVGATHGAAGGAADAGSGRATCCSAHGRTSLLRRADASTPRCSPSADVRRARPSVDAAPLRLGRRSAAARTSADALARALRRRHPRRHRLDRDAAHLPLQPRRRRALRHHRQAGAGLRACELVDDDGARSRARRRWASCRCAGRPAR